MSDAAQGRAEALCEGVREVLAELGVRSLRGEVDKLDALITQALRAEREQGEQAGLEKAATIAERRRISDVEGDWDKGYNMAVVDIAGALREQARAGEGRNKVGSEGLTMPEGVRE